MKQIMKQLIGVEQHKSYVIIPLHHMQEIWNKKSHRNIPIDGLELFTAMIINVCFVARCVLLIHSR